MTALADACAGYAAAAEALKILGAAALAWLTVTVVIVVPYVIWQKRHGGRRG